MQFNQIKNKMRNTSVGKRLIKADIGRYKAWYQRVALYVTGFNFFMIFYNFTQKNNWMTWYAWLFVFVVSLFTILFVDIVFIWESEQYTSALKNPVIMEMRDKINYLYKKEGGK